MSTELSKRRDVQVALAQNPISCSSEDTNSHWQLICRRFAKHRIATCSVFVLGVFYISALLAEFLAPHDPNWRNLDYAYAPPQIPRFNLSHGLYIYGFERRVDPVTLNRTYFEDQSYIFQLRLFGVDQSANLFPFPFHRRLLTAEDAPQETSANGLKGDHIPFYFLGADKYGRDLFSRLIHGARISLSVGLLSVVITLFLGVLIGGLSGYFGGFVDNLIQRTIEVVDAFPQLPLWLVIGALFPPDWSPVGVYLAIILTLSLLNWTGLARVVRGKMLSLREEDYAVAAQTLGACHRRIIFRHLMPAVTSHVLVVLTVAVPRMILGETALSFLGLGLRPPIISWGVMLQDCLNMQAVASQPWLLVPVLPITLVTLAFNFIGDGLRDAADPYGQ